MRHYELMVILDPELEERTIAPSLDRFLTVVTKAGGTVKTEIWGRRRLAYEIKKQIEGIYKRNLRVLGWTRMRICWWWRAVCPAQRRLSGDYQGQEATPRTAWIWWHGYGGSVEGGQEGGKEGLVVVAGLRMSAIGWLGCTEKTYGNYRYS